VYNDRNGHRTFEGPGMSLIYHLTTPAAWGHAPNEAYRTPSLAKEGFIHCAFADQVAEAASRFYRDVDDVLVLEIETSRLSSPVHTEPARQGEEFPHVYGPIQRDAVVAILPLQRGPFGGWQFSAGR
jgi:uncharacterized protein (DUF952 family)